MLCRMPEMMDFECVGSQRLTSLFVQTGYLSLEGFLIYYGLVILHR
jgi:hypothetical protein